MWVCRSAVKNTTLPLVGISPEKLQCSFQSVCVSHVPKRALFWKLICISSSYIGNMPVSCLLVVFPCPWYHSCKVYVALCRLSVCAHREGWEPGHHPDSDLGAKLPHPETGWGGNALHHSRELSSAQKCTPPRTKVGVTVWPTFQDNKLF